MITLKAVSKKYENLVILDNVDLEIPEGQKVAVIGSSGCGKSTLLRLILRLEEVTTGKIYIDDQEIGLLSQDHLADIRRNIGMVFQSSALFDSLTVFENVAFALRQHSKIKENDIMLKVEEKLEMVGLSGKGDLMPSELSGGMQKRVGIARTLVSDPKIILYDEPTTGLDPITSTSIEDTINDLSSKAKVTSIVVTHQLSTIFRTANRIVMMYNSKFIECGSVPEAKNSNNKVIKDFLSPGI
ncbi:hypothetical protein A2526_01360 [candidate division WOR-1 bacterium RIFOXYD2_FULL_36_8]|uniref:ABC transporter domain-containing protein n=1 Tax=candidate division WOR-1 bacterium RIFOXYB2_FULL_36_35 TaxID=1802578 RepID=A0A1F4S2P4_UNCSA|nr:MAG: hypothetical protein A2230_07900 [candidate division WOR-1 bacterium RIFOXYA2_FULL_36_21]OGC14714.1 MAG: hypothetical protein A2290_00385 [candidate division WOR-1 bacterium RIFOXYB2_FULL_36_35]OGC19009.1 MAG: hypothetical protein A2282_02315 [candidate division WOR-1 bacterium RIFOXYA12_FULL_36_13]OGC37803.1 MAG: hypothetical protein A2526_01360 [candidate division WOR-1 bacterium RIFOXYD2_FULL_36_8]